MLKVFFIFFILIPAVVIIALQLAFWAHERKKGNTPEAMNMKKKAFNDVVKPLIDSELSGITLPEKSPDGHLYTIIVPDKARSVLLSLNECYGFDYITNEAYKYVASKYPQVTKVEIEDAIISMYIRIYTKPMTKEEN